ncbi:hypothetical protein [Tenuifilum thalassicum]|uniref:Uncharacterized protein n=1 Tax=Tenuifilum thalassicum TaxID=2590900 RepID=A0A7D3XE30_9BACT|nr:hypothetical protein [Tenuifilum thalassicum]QKG80032.1 hypothetical protein FHG85_07070 [Tenuifilum thalassicum]
MCSITIIRPKNEKYYSEGKLKITIDGETVGKIYQGEKLTLELSGSEHTLRATTVLKMGSRTITLKGDEQKEIEVKVNPNFNFSPQMAITQIPLFTILWMRFENIWIKSSLALVAGFIIIFFVRMLLKGRTEAILIKEINK